MPSIDDEDWTIYKTAKPKDKGQAKLSKKYGDRLVTIRYWKNNRGDTRKTVELVEKIELKKQDE